MIDFDCSCGEPLQAEEQYAGRITRCPRCGREQAIPTARDTTIRGDAPRERARSSNLQQREDKYDSRRYEGAPRPVGPQTSGKALAALIFGLASLVFNVFAAIPAVILGLLALLDISKSQGRLTGKGLALVGMFVSVFSMLCIGPGLGYGLYWGIGRVRTASNQSASRNNLKQMAIAMHNYHDANGYLPPAQGILPSFMGGPGMAPKAGPAGIVPKPDLLVAEQPKVSWRVRILPYIEQGNLYNQYNFNEPWDGPNNIKLLARMPKVYELPGDQTAPAGSTYYQVFVSKPSAFPRAIFSTDPIDKPSLLQITDGTANTIMIVEAATPVPWTKPDDIPFDNNAIVPQLGTHWNGGCNAAFADGHVDYIPSTIPSTTLKALITRDGGEMVNWGY